MVKGKTDHFGLPCLFTVDACGKQSQNAISL